VISSITSICRSLQSFAMAVVVESVAPACEDLDRRSRPNLRRFCHKSKMCKNFLRGMCNNGESCHFAHKESDVVSQPDLSCTKMCPKMLKTGACSKGSACKFAHHESELRRLDVDDFEPPVKICDIEPLTRAPSRASTIVWSSCGSDDGNADDDDDSVVERFEVKVQNTFIHLVAASVAKPRRSRSVPCMRDESDRLTKSKTF